MNPRWIKCLVLCTLAHGGTTFAGVGEAGEVVRVYTNEDIERLAPLPSQRAPLMGFDKERWEYVIQFLEREYERLNADRNLDLARAILRAEVEASLKTRQRYSLAQAPNRSFLRR